LGHAGLAEKIWRDLLRPPHPLGEKIMKRILVTGLMAGLGLLALAAPALAGPRDDVLFGISRCGGIADDRTWLDCVYGAAQPMRAQLGLAPAPLSQQKLVPPAGPGTPTPSAQAFGAPPPAERPGFLMRMLTPKHDSAEQPTKLASYKFDASGHFTVTLANGETWEQDIGDSARALWTRPAATYTAQIVPSAFSYHYLKVGPEQFMVNKN
jgi:hypothetical protein